MPRNSSSSSSSRSSSSSSSNKTCPPHKFGVLNGCMSWSMVLAIMALCSLLVIYSLIVMNKHSGSNSNSTMIKNNISSNISSNNNNSHNNSRNNIPRINIKNINMPRQLEFTQDEHNMEHEDRIEGIDKTNDGRDNTGTPTSDRVQYDINVNIRDTINNRNSNARSYDPYEYNKNMERVINPLLPPERSYVNTYGIPINIPSRGPQQTYQQVGILYKDNIEDTNKTPGNNNDSNILPLFGRPSYSGSKRWHYYTSSDKYHSIKLPINIDGRKCTDDVGCNELMNSDSISIPSYNGTFKVEIYDYDRPRYIPNVL